MIAATASVNNQPRVSSNRQHRKGFQVRTSFTARAGNGGGDEGVVHYATQPLLPILTYSSPNGGKKEIAKLVYDLDLPEASRVHGLVYVSVPVEIFREMVQPKPSAFNASVSRDVMSIS